MHVSGKYKISPLSPLKMLLLLFLHILPLAFLFFFVSGSWYSSNPKELDRQISRWLDAAGERVGVARAIVSPYVLSASLFTQ